MGFTDDPARVADGLRAYNTTGFVACVVIPAALTLLPVVVLSAMGTPMRLVDVDGLILWLLVIAHLPSAVWVRDALRRRDESVFRRAFFVQSQVQLQWLLLLTWRMGAQLPLVSTGVLFGMMLGWAFQDAQLSHGTPIVEQQYLIAFALFDAALLARDATHGRGCCCALAVDRGSRVIPGEPGDPRGARPDGARDHGAHGARARGGASARAPPPRRENGPPHARAPPAATDRGAPRGRRVGGAAHATSRARSPSSGSASRRSGRC